MRNVIAQRGLQSGLAVLQARDLGADFGKFVGQGHRVHSVLGACVLHRRSGNLINKT
jgi:hypothetical protein